MRIIFMGTPDFSVSVLEALHGAGHEIVAVYSQPPRRAGRGKKARPSPVQKCAEGLGLPVFTPLNFKDESDRAAFAAHSADIAVVVAYGLILPQAVLDMPALGCLNIHASLLPRWRGAAPIQRAIMAGDEKTGVCIMQMEAGLDTGPVIARLETEISAEDTAASLHDTLAEIGSRLIVEVLEANKFNAKPQPSEGVTYASKIDKSEAKIDWQQPALTIDRQIRGLSPFPGAWCEMKGERVKILGSVVTEGTGLAGEALDDAFTIACGQGAAQLIKLQRAGKGPMDAEAFSRGFPLLKGEKLG
ncbi:MAG TPA: methionyl-tRNA formyltransferase [Rhodobacteraceae bacterium]|nr:methionyl-tRNA formyltransferase [Paracoccaceae bacterium]